MLLSTSDDLGLIICLAVDSPILLCSPGPDGGYRVRDARISTKPSAGASAGGAGGGGNFWRGRFYSCTATVSISRIQPSNPSSVRIFSHFVPSLSSCCSSRYCRGVPFSSVVTGSPESTLGPGRRCIRKSGLEMCVALKDATVGVGVCIGAVAVAVGLLSELEPRSVLSGSTSVWAGAEVGVN
jgi:hypothetical protein